ncbi:MAG: type IV secretory system conjugative DNA transfer family protein [Candidatus Omnitrophica bacterium]|nr:type IV secretory system conjugative DNA transfer family protein [Candidatus Omnitrophota bacterium]
MPKRSYNLRLGKVTVKNVTQRTIALIGQKGSGKTTAIRLMAREFDKMKLPVLVIDPTGAAVDADFFNMKVPAGLGKEEKAALYQAIDTAWNEKAPLVMDISDMNRKEAAELSAELFPYLLHKQDGIVIVDEIPDLTPQFGEFKSEELIRFNRKCRNRNIGFVFGTQRPASVSKDVLALADVLLIMRLAWPGDMEAVEKILKRKYKREELDGTMQKVSHFGAGDVLVVDFRTKG